MLFWLVIVALALTVPLACWVAERMAAAAVARFRPVVAPPPLALEATGIPIPEDDAVVG